MTFKSVSDLEEGFDRAREDYEQLRSHLQSEEDLDVDYVEDILDRQSERIEQLETARSLREEYEEERPEEYRERVQRLKSLRDETEELLEELMDELEKGMNSVDQNLQVMDRYEQDKGESYYLDETI